MATPDSLKLDAGRRAWEFTARHPDSSEAGQLAAAELGKLVAATRGVMQEQLTVGAALGRATDELRALGRPLRDALALIAHFGSVAAMRRRRRDLRIQLRTRPKLPNAFLAEARSIQRLALADQTLLLHYGMHRDLLPRLARDLDHFEAALARREMAEEDLRRVRADLTAIGQEMYALIRRLDAVYRPRFAGDPELLAEWTQARAIQENRGRESVA